MNVEINNRQLENSEIEVLQREIIASPDISVFPDKRWSSFSSTYVADVGNQFAGVCATIKLKEWVKLGPFVILDEFQGNGFGSKLLNHTAEELYGEKLFIGSSNPAVWRMVERLDFTRVTFVDLPNDVKLYFLQYIFKNLSVVFLLDAIKKNLFSKRGEYKTFLRE